MAPFRPTAAARSFPSSPDPHGHFSRVCNAAMDVKTGAAQVSDRPNPTFEMTPAAW
jgi:hypothetical protein